MNNNSVLLGLLNSDKWEIVCTVQKIAKYLPERTILSWHLRNCHKLKFPMKWLTFSCLICALKLYFAQKLLEVEVAIAWVQTSFLLFTCGKGTFPFPRATKEIGDVCTQAKVVWDEKLLYLPIQVSLSNVRKEIYKKMSWHWPDRNLP